MLLSVSFVAAAFAAVPVMADPAVDRDPIYDRWNACMRTPANFTTPGMVNCSDSTAKKYGALLNALYQGLEKRKDLIDGKLLAASQHQWIAFRQAERKTLSGWEEKNDGTIFRVVAAQSNMEALRERVGELEAYFPGQEPEGPNSWQAAARHAPAKTPCDQDVSSLPCDAR